jgi:hypothetical protein
MNVPHLLPRAGAAILVGLVLAAPSGALADDTAPGTTWSLSPAGTDGDGGTDDRVSLRHVIGPGETADDQVALTNFSPHPATFAVYASDGIVTPDGSFDLLPPGEHPVDGGAWIDIGAVGDEDPAAGETMTIEVPADETVVIPLRIAVPPDASPGDHPAGLVAQFVPAEGSGVEMASRVGVRVHLRVDGPVVTALAVDAVSVAYEPSWNPFSPGTVRVDYTLGNTGNVRLGATSTTTIAGPFGIAPASHASTIREILPGDAVQASSTFDVWPLLLGYGEVQVAPEVVGEDVPAGTVAASTTSFTVWTVPWSQIALLAVVSAAVVLILRLRRRSSARVQRRIDEAVARAVGSDGPVAAGAQPDAVDAPPGEGGPATAPTPAPAGAVAQAGGGAVEERMASRG